MAFPRSDGSRSLSKFTLLCALNLCLLQGIQYADAAGTCLMTASSGDSAAGIKIVADSSCRSLHFTPCDNIEPATPTSAPTTTTKAPLPQATSKTPVVVPSNTPASTTAPPTLPPTEKQVGDPTSISAQCSIADGDLAVGIEVIDDSSCASGGLGCFNSHCRYCKVGDTPQSKHLLSCVSLGADYPTISPMNTNASSSACEVSQGDFNVGINVVSDATCANVQIHPEPGSSERVLHLRSCVRGSNTGSVYSVITRWRHPRRCCWTDTVSYCETISVTGVCCHTDADFVAGKRCHPNANSVTSADTSSNSYSHPNNYSPFWGTLDTPTGPTPCPSSVKPTPSSEKPSEGTLDAVSTPTSTPAPTPCSSKLSTGDADAGIQVITWTNCAEEGGVGCFDTVCRFCRVWTTPQSAHLNLCTSLGYYFGSLIGSQLDVTPSPSDTATAPLALDSGLCVASSDDNAVGIHGVAATNCVQDGLGCFLDDACRYCKTANTPQSAHLHSCSELQAPATSAPATPATSLIVPCAVSSGDQAVGIRAVIAMNCATDGLGYFQDNFCRPELAESAVAIEAPKSFIHASRISDCVDTDGEVARRYPTRG
ncbi:hypothetical protein FI667_g1294, partial [Globisporangium splendens]